MENKTLHLWAFPRDLYQKHSYKLLLQKEVHFVLEYNHDL